jgi:hypothetical protein
MRIIDNNPLNPRFLLLSYWPKRKSMALLKVAAVDEHHYNVTKMSGLWVNITIWNRRQSTTSQLLNSYEDVKYMA